MRTPLALITTLCLTLLSLVACTSQTPPPNSPPQADSSESSDPQPETRDQLTVGLTYIPDVQFGPMYVALDKGYFADAGLDVTLRHHGAQEALFWALENGTEDIVFAGASEMMQARAQGLDVVNWATLYQNYPVSLITTKESGITSPADLIGKKVGLPGAYGENYSGLLAMLDRYQLKDKVKIDYIGYTQTAALMGHQVDAVIGYKNNDAVALAQAGLDVITMPLTDEELPLIGVGLGSLKKNLHPKVYARFLQALERATTDIKADPEGALDIIAQHVPSLTDPEQRTIASKVLTQTMKLYLGDHEFGYQDGQRWEKMSIFLAKTKIVKKAVPPLDAYTAEVVTLAKKKSR